MNNLTSILILLGGYAFVRGAVWVFRDEIVKLQNEQLKEVTNENERTKQAQNNFDNLSDGDKSKWLFNLLEKRKNNIK